jgi:DNA-directed RNA polymerase specialized sigma24 family protein
MHRIVIQHARRRGALKRGGAAQAVALDEGLAATPNDTDHLDLETALQRLRCRRPRRHLIVEMHYRGGYTVEEIAAAIGASARSVERELSAGRTWLKEQMPSAS